MKIPEQELSNHARVVPRRQYLQRWFNDSSVSMVWQLTNCTIRKQSLAKLLISCKLQLSQILAMANQNQTQKRIVNIKTMFIGKGRHL